MALHFQDLELIGVLRIIFGQKDTINFMTTAFFFFKCKKEYSLVQEMLTCVIFQRATAPGF